MVDCPIDSGILRAKKEMPMEKTALLKDGTSVLIRELRPDDLDKLMKFYKELPLVDRKYLRVDVTDRDVVAGRIARIETGKVIRIVAVHNDEIIADGALELFGEAWKRHQGEIRVIVARAFQKKRLGMAMIQELYNIAAQKNLEVLVATMMRPQVGAQQIFRKLGFREEMLLPDFVRDIQGSTQDLIIMTCSLKDLWKEIEDFHDTLDRGPRGE
jgi:L-amino acid N-acyltransferase YncA